MCCLALENVDNRIIGRRMVELALSASSCRPGTKLGVVQLSGIERLRAYDTT